jgi:ppGpp synthetase/RelA/SpoT-type nucleotidyltranferase
MIRMDKILSLPQLTKKLSDWSTPVKQVILDAWAELSEKQKYELSTVLSTKDPRKLAKMLKDYATESKNLEAQQSTIQDKFYLNVSIDS